MDSAVAYTCPASACDFSSCRKKNILSHSRASHPRSVILFCGHCDHCSHKVSKFMRHHNREHHSQDDVSEEVVSIYAPYFLKEDKFFKLNLPLKIHCFQCKLQFPNVKTFNKHFHEHVNDDSENTVDMDTVLDDSILDQPSISIYSPPIEKDTDLQDLILNENGFQNGGEGETLKSKRTKKGALNTSSLKMENRYESVPLFDDDPDNTVYLDTVLDDSVLDQASISISTPTIEKVKDTDPQDLISNENGFQTGDSGETPKSKRAKKRPPKTPPVLKDTDLEDLILNESGFQTGDQGETLKSKRPKKRPLKTSSLKIDKNRDERVPHCDDDPDNTVYLDTVLDDSVLDQASISISTPTIEKVKDTDPQDLISNENGFQTGDSGKTQKSKRAKKMPRKTPPVLKDTDLEDLILNESGFQTGDQGETRKSKRLKKRRWKASPLENYSFCPVCSKSVLRLRHHLLIHSKTKTQTKKYVCELCDYETIWKKDLNTHMIVHSMQKRHKCELCLDKYFGTVSDLNKHNLIHLDHRSFVCEICHKGFRLNHQLKRHIKVIHEQPRRKRKIS